MSCWIEDGLMQTFLPFKSFQKTAKCLDYRRLGKQRVETMQILKALSQENYGWKNHPATKMWKGYETCLSYYGIVICEEWISRGYNDTCLYKISQIVEPNSNAKQPNWLGNFEFHNSHKSNL